MPRKPADTIDETVRARLVRDLQTVTRRCENNQLAGEKLREHRDRVIRDALAAGLTPAEIAQQTGLKAAEISKL